MPLWECPLCIGTGAPWPADSAPRPHLPYSYTFSRILGYIGRVPELEPEISCHQVDVPDRGGRQGESPVCSHVLKDLQQARILKMVQGRPAVVGVLRVLVFPGTGKTKVVYDGRPPNEYIALYFNVDATLTGYELPRLVDLARTPLQHQPAGINHWIRPACPAPLEFAAIDIVNAYLCHELPSKISDVCGVRVKGQYFVFDRLPYGLALGPRLQQKKSVGAVCTVLDWYPQWVVETMMVFVLLDDFLFSSSLHTLAQHVCKDLRGYLISEGYAVHGEAKSTGLVEVAHEAEWHGKLWSSDALGNIKVCPTAESRKALEDEVESMAPGWYPAKQITSLLGKVVWAHTPVLACMPFIGQLYGKLHYESINITVKDLSMLKKSFDVLVKDPVVSPRMLFPDWSCKAVTHESHPVIYTDFAEINAHGALLYACACGEVYVKQFRRGMEQSCGEDFTFQQAILAVYMNDLPCCMSNPPYIVILGDNGCSLRPCPYKAPASTQYDARKLALANVQHPRKKPILYGWIAGTDNPADLYTRDQFGMYLDWTYLYTTRHSCRGWHLPDY